MAKQQILLVDADASSARLLEVSLRGAGFNIATAKSAEDAFGKLEHGTPDLILTEARLPGVDGFTFVRTLRGRPELAETPIVFLTEQGALEDKLRGLELGVDDYLAKPIMVREVVTRVQLLLARKKQQRTLTEPQARTRFSGSLEDVAVVDVLQTVAISGKSGVASVKRGEREALLYFDRGQIIDAEVGDLRGEEAVYRTITWATGTFDVEFRPVERERVIEVSHQGLLMEGLRRVDELGRLGEQLPPENAVVDVDHDALASRLDEIPDELNGILRLIDGKRTLLDLIDASPFDDLSTLTVLSKFYFEGLLLSVNPEPVEWAPGSRPLPAVGRPSVPPSSDHLREAASPVVTPAPPSAHAADASPTLPAPMESLRETRRPTPLPATARAAAPESEAKLTPKGIVNVGDSLPPPPKQMPSPFKAANDATRRSPIPMPAGIHSRSNGANGATGHAGSRDNGGRESRTMHGLSATPLQRGMVQSAPAVVLPFDMEVAPDAKRRAADAVVIDVAVREHAEPQTPPARNVAPVGSVPRATPEPEHEFFEAGDEGTYAGGPHSIVPERSVSRDSDEPSAASRKGHAPSRHMRARRSTMIVAGVLAVAVVSLLVAGVRHLSGSAKPSPESGASALPTSVQQPGGSASVSPPVPSVSPPSAAVAASSDAGSAGDGTAPPPVEVPPSAREAPSGSAAPKPSAGATVAGTPPSVAVTPNAAPRPPLRKAPTAPAPAPAAPANPRAPAVEKPSAPPAALTKPGEKPPTASYPLQ